ncbi:FAD:protein FMN transferase [Oscillibacter sp. MSJ-2]|uniref:FAD:protein FMN transferase n=1 Tax=Dysosmobacter acutus TaxID=2841504 RepID=A0ABS6F6X3_9FIRM|nr:FAD:protein FMN transferase [Dysosmobacter acutus]MBU5626024.1 FAD:protein FMN transferase [Dysosmobacter acutus]
MKHFFALLLPLLLLSGCAGREGDPQTAQIFAMDTIMDFTVYGPSATDAIDSSTQEIQRLERLLSRTLETSEVSRLNESAGKASETTKEVSSLLEKAVRLSAATGGAFDITVAPLASAWGFTEAEYRVPSEEEISQLLPLVGSGRIHITGQQVELADGMAIDLGGIAKGYASDQVERTLQGYGVESAIISLGGNVYARGTKPDGGPWRVAVRDPGDPADYVGMLLLEDAYAVTSGGYQRYFEQDGQTYHHIIDPSTGCPADSDLTSVTVVSSSGTVCDALSTALFVLGEQGAVGLWEGTEWERGFDMVLVTEDGRVLITAGLADRFEPKEGSAYVYETLS